MDFSEFNKLPFEKKLLTGFFTLMLLVVFMPLVVVLISRATNLRSSAAPASILTLAPSTANPGLNQPFQVNVNINTGANQVIGVELYIRYDQTKLSAQPVTPGSFFSNPQTIPGDLGSTTGLLVYTIYLGTASTPQSGTGTVAVLNFTPIAEGSSTISFDADTIVGAIGEGGQNVLVSTNPTTITIGNTTTVTPTPTKPDTNEPIITSISPTSGAIGTNVTILGANMMGSQGCTNNLDGHCFPELHVQVNNGANCPATSYSATMIVFAVCEGSTTGKIKVTHGEIISTSTEDFTVNNGTNTPTPTGGNGTITPTSTDIVPADINQDHVVDIQDYTLLWQDFGKTEPANPRSDINNDGKVNLLDYVLLFESFQ